MKLKWMGPLQEDRIALSPTLFNRLFKFKTITIHFGSFKKHLKPIMYLNLKEDEFGISENVCSNYTFPQELAYECRLVKSDLFIGPVIAYVKTKEIEHYTKEELSYMIPRFAGYEDIKGLLFICTRECIDLDNNIIKGYYYSPQTGKEDPWIFGEFPLPDAIYNRSFLQKEKMSKLREIVGEAVFNSDYRNIDKWHFWSDLKERDSVCKHLPYTELYTDFSQVKKFLGQYDSMYLKARRKNKGKGTFHISKTKKGYLVRDEKQNKKLISKLAKLKKYLQQNVVFPSIIQQPVPFKVGKRQLDFRVYLQKNETKEWCFQGLTSRITKEDSVVTNTIGRDSLIRGKEALIAIYQLTEEQASIIQEKMISITKEAVSIYEESGEHYADVAADVILDGNHHVWILELQFNYAAEKKVHEIPPEIFSEIMTTPFQYAKSLTKFS